MENQKNTSETSMVKEDKGTGYGKIPKSAAQPVDRFEQNLMVPLCEESRKALFGSERKQFPDLQTAVRDGKARTETHDGMAEEASLVQAEKEPMRQDGI